MKYKYNNKDIKFGERMWWTVSIKSVAYVILILGIIGSIICALKYIEDSETLAAVLIAAGGIGCTFLSVGGIMMICEISENIYEINLVSQEKMEDTSNSSGAAQKSYSLDRMAAERNITDDKWKCPNCGRLNKKTDMTCKDCGTSK